MGPEDLADKGSATPRLVLIHGSGDSSRAWVSVIRALDWDASQVVALDLPGHGQREAEPLPTPPSVAAYAAAVRRDVESRGWEHLTLAGHSLGSAIALHLARQAPALVARLVLVGAGARLRVAPTLLETARSQPIAAWKQLAALGHAPDRQAITIEPPPLAPGALWNDLTACDGFDMLGQLGDVEQPTLVLVGAADQLTPPRYATYLVEHLPRATLVTIPGAGHYLMDEEPLAVAQAIRAWLDA